MQLVEVSEIGVRAAIVRLVSPNAKLVWLMFPMIHLGEREYYAEVERRMADCDLVLAEGIDSRIVSALTASYRNMAGLRDAVVQPDPISTSSAEVVNADISGAEFDEAWKQMPFAMRMAVPLLSPLYGLWVRYTASPESWHRNLETSDLPDDLDLELQVRLPHFFDLIFGRRDRHLFEQIEVVQGKWSGEDRVVGVAWGAGHIGAVVHHLSSRWGYFGQSADWITVFDYTRERR